MKRQKAGSRFVSRETCGEGRNAKVLIYLLKLFATIPNQTFGEDKVTILRCKMFHMKHTYNKKQKRKQSSVESKKKNYVSRETNQIMNVFRNGKNKRLFYLRFQYLSIVTKQK